MSRASLIEEPRTLAHLLEELGGIDPRRVLLKPAPGKATEKDLLRLNDHSNRLYELVDGVLVEKAMGFAESVLGAWLGSRLYAYLEQHDLGFVLGADGPLRLMPRLVRLPDVAFISWNKVPVRGIIPDVPIGDMAPDLAVEVLSEGNTRAEMERKLKEYFLAGVQLVWFVDPDERTVKVYTAPDQARVFSEADTLDGGDVLPGLSLPVKQIFARLPPKTAGQPRKGPGRKRPNKRGPR